MNATIKIRKQINACLIQIRQNFCKRKCDVTACADDVIVGAVMEYYFSEKKNYSNGNYNVKTHWNRIHIRFEISESYNACLNNYEKNDWHYSPNINSTEI